MAINPISRPPSKEEALLGRDAFVSWQQQFQQAHQAGDAGWLSKLQTAYQHALLAAQADQQRAATIKPPTQQDWLQEKLNDIMSIFK